MTQDEKNRVATGAGAGSGPGGAEPLATRDVELSTCALPRHKVVSGSPSTGSRTVRTFDDVEVGIWEMTPGSAREVLLRPGDMMSLFKGERAVWTVTETLRKVYVLRPDDASPE